MKNRLDLDRLARTWVILATIITSTWLGTAPLQSTTARNVSDVTSSCDEDITLDSGWRDPIDDTTVDKVMCYRLSSVAVSQIRRENLRSGQPFVINFSADSGQFDIHLIRVTGTATPIARAANRLNPSVILPGTKQSFAAGTLRNGSYVVMVVPRAAGIYGLTFSVGAATNTAAPSAPTIVTSTSQPNQCSATWGTLSNFCIESPGLTVQNGAINVVWRIANFRYGEFDSGDGRGFVGPVSAEQRVVVNNVSANRTIQLRWWDLNNVVRTDTLQVILGSPAPSPTQVPQIPVNPNYFPCSRAGIGTSNLCIEQPYPIRRGTNAVVVWRINSFQSGSFDNGDGRGFVGPISAEQRIVVTNVTSNRTVYLRWIDTNGVTQTDSFTIQVVD